jgi:hypothetical protein
VNLQGTITMKLNQTFATRHPYGNREPSIVKKVCFPGASYIAITFDSRCSVGSYHVLTFYRDEVRAACVPCVRVVGD